VLSAIAPLAKIKQIAIDNQCAGYRFAPIGRVSKQVFYNLLSNAVKFTPENGRVWIADASRGGCAGFLRWRHWNRHSGFGLESIFDEFHQVGGPTGAEKEGHWPGF